jgi:hypothetical protein
MNFTHNNHLTYSIGNREFGHRQDSIEKYNVKVGSIDKDHYKKSNFQQELLRTADLVYNDYGKEFALFLSGGTDSEIVLRNFLSIGVKPKCYTIKFKNDYNQPDVQQAVDLANELDVPLNLIDFDIKDFLYSGEATEFGSKVQCTQVTYLMVYYSILKLGMPAVMGGEVFLRRNINTVPSTWYYTLRENEDASAMRFSNLYNIPVVNEWFTYTPELLLYYLEDPGVVELVTNRFNYKMTSATSKNAILKRLLPDIVWRQTKTHGFERLLGFNYEAYRQLSGEQIARLEPSLDGIEYEDVKQMLWGTYENS